MAGLPKRIVKETERLMAEPYAIDIPGGLYTGKVYMFPHSVPGINAVPHDDNVRYFDVTIHGPSQSPYEGEGSPGNPIRYPFH